MKQSSSKKGKIGLVQSLIHIYPIPALVIPILFAPLHPSSLKKPFLGKKKKNTEGHLLPLSLHITPVHASLYVKFGVFTAMSKKNSCQPRYDTV